MTGKTNLTRLFSLGTLLLLLYSGTKTVAADWPTFGHDPQRSGSTDETILSPPIKRPLQPHHPIHHLLWDPEKRKEEDRNQV